MACIIHATDKRSGLTYAYRSESYWDKEKKAPRCRRTLLGRVDTVTGEIVPTDGRRRKKMSAEAKRPEPPPKPDPVSEESKKLASERKICMTDLKNRFSQIKQTGDDLKRLIDQYEIELRRLQSLES